ncbi:MAG TPA: TlyA family RNA methyltransferase [Xanthobacteraceae bacterium]|nr:TlyA family RNA methyltransferase [Xanthobacteraceae bacterium]
MQRRRADLLLVERGLFESRAKAQAAIAAGLVTADDRPVTKASAEIPVDAKLSAAPAHPYVSRGGVKLAAALDHAAIEVTGRVCLDVGASTGGFTEVLLSRGARLVYAVDVGRDQLHPRLRGRPDVISLEGTDVRALDPAALPEPPDLVVIDASFISLKLVVPAAMRLAAPRADLVALVKPQFELKRSDLKKGIVRDERLQTAVCDDIAAFLAAQGCEVVAILPSPIAGGDGNREFFVIARR